MVVALWSSGGKVVLEWRQIGGNDGSDGSLVVVMIDCWQSCRREVVQQRQNGVEVVAVVAVVAVEFVVLIPPKPWLRVTPLSLTTP